MSQLSDYKAAPINLFGQGTDQSTGTGTVDPSITSSIGAKFNLADGRQVALVSVGTVALASGKLVQSAAQTTAFSSTGLAITVPTTYPATAGTFQILATNSTTVLNINQYAGGYLVVSSGTGIGQTLQINSHQPAASSATFVINLVDPIQVTLDATSTVTLLNNPYQNVIIAPATETGVPVGATFYPLAASVANTYNGTSGALTVQGTQQFGFIVTKGTIGILVDNTVTNVGYSVGRSAATAGAVGVETLTTAGFVGTAMQTLTSAQTGLIFLDL